MEGVDPDVTAFSASTIPLAVRVSNARYDGLITGYIVGGIRFQLNDPGGLGAASFTVSARQGFRSDMLQPYSRVYIYDKRTGDTIHEGDISHPGRVFGDGGALLEVQVEGGSERLNDWFGARIYCDSDFQPWTKTSDSLNATAVDGSADDRGGSGNDALTLAFDTSTHVETNYRVLGIYQRIAEAGQQMGRINYSWDAGMTNASWLIRLIVGGPGSFAARSDSASTAGSGGSAAYVGPSWDAPAAYAYLELIWTSNPSNTGDLDIIWASIFNLTVVAYLWLKDGTRRAGSAHNDYVTAVQVWEDMLGDPLLLAGTFDGPGARLDTGLDFHFLQLAFPDGVTPQGVADEMMKMETNSTYIVGPSSPVTGKYTLTWLDRPTTVRYEVMVWADHLTNGTQPVEQFNRSVIRWRSRTGNLRISVATQAIPEMDAAGRTRSAFQDLSDITGETANVAQANATALSDHRYPRNGGQVEVSRPIVDLFTGRRVMPWEIQPAYLIRQVGIDPTPDGLNATFPNGSTVCRIVSNEYDSGTGTATLTLDSFPLSLFKAIAQARKALPLRKR